MDRKLWLICVLTGASGCIHSPPAYYGAPAAPGGYVQPGYVQPGYTQPGFQQGPIINSPGTTFPGGSGPTLAPPQGGGNPPPFNGGTGGGGGNDFGTDPNLVPGYRDPTSNDFGGGNPGNDLGNDDFGNGDFGNGDFGGGSGFGEPPLDDGFGNPPAGGGGPSNDTPFFQGTMNPNERTGALAQIQSRSWDDPGELPGRPQPLAESNVNFGARPQEDLPGRPNRGAIRPAGHDNPARLNTGGGLAAADFETDFGAVPTGREAFGTPPNAEADFGAYPTGREDFGSNPVAEAPSDPPEDGKLFGYDRRKYRWLKGMISYDERQRSWNIIYNTSPGIDDEYGGSLTLADSGRLSKFKTNDIVEVVGTVDRAAGVDELGKPKFRVDTARIIGMAQ
ncbi:hypothetical protein [Stratiformator vulcanicus]|uniref:Uncharacterized protein n=1 Tax=Stratiformator vulcanicus TaxID=2527980 RepID=A0A517R7L1_9PLAN|nr:hypothetical protein [Stratiformator vulcanicus]QDT39879.1 hypothetical protein Pan189_42910 [Stratiformator vulcanicus]